MHTCIGAWSRRKVAERIRPRVKLNLNSSYRYPERVLFDSSRLFDLSFSFLSFSQRFFSPYSFFFLFSFFQTEVVMLFSGSVKSYFVCERINSPDVSPFALSFVSYLIFSSSLSPPSFFNSFFLSFLFFVLTLLFLPLVEKHDSPKLLSTRNFRERNGAL